MTSEPTGRSLHLFFINDKPDGMVTAVMPNWNGHILMTPRTQIADALKRPEASRVGVYLLIGEADGRPLLYVGEGQNISKRISNHDAEKDWWETAIFVTATDDQLDRARAKYLEMRLLEEARALGKAKLDNGNQPGKQPLAESAIADMEVFLARVFVVLPALRVDLFVKNTRGAPSVSSSNERPIGSFELYSPKYQLRASARHENGELIVLSGSQARLNWDSKEVSHTYAHLHEELFRQGILKNEGTHLAFSQNYAFKSPSAAAAVILGRPTNGTTDWKLKDSNKTYKQWEAEQIAAST